MSSKHKITPFASTSFADWPWASLSVPWWHTNWQFHCSTWVNNGRFFRLMVFVATSVVFRFGGSGGGASSVATSWPEGRAISSVGSKLSPDSTSVSLVTWFSELDDGSSLSTWNVLSPNWNSYSSHNQRNKLFRRGFRKQEFSVDKKFRKLRLTDWLNQSTNRTLRGHPFINYTNF